MLVPTVLYFLFPGNKSIRKFSRSRSFLVLREISFLQGSARFKGPRLNMYNNAYVVHGINNLFPLSIFFFFSFMSLFPSFPAPSETKGNKEKDSFWTDRPTDRPTDRLDRLDRLTDGPRCEYLLPKKKKRRGGDDKKRPVGMA